MIHAKAPVKAARWQGDARRQLLQFLRGVAFHLAEKSQRQVPISRHDGATGVIGKIIGAPAAVAARQAGRC